MGARRLAQQVRVGGLECRLSADEEGETAPPHIELATYRIAQGALDNARSHARARAVDIDLACGLTWLRLRIADDGVGIDGDAARRALRRGRIGLAEIYHWADEVGGSVDITGTPGGGTEVVFRWGR